MQKLEVQQFSNYLDFLNAYVNLKKKNPSWSLGVWKRQLNLKSTSTLTMLLKGQRHPGRRLTQELVRHFDFDPQEQKYFESLVEVQKKVKDPSLALFLLKSPEVLAKESLKTLTQVTSLDELFFKRLTHVIREMTLLRDFQPTGKWIQEKLLEKVPLDSALEFIEKLMQARLLEKHENGSLRATDFHATSSPRPKEMIKEFHKEVLSSSLHALEKCPEDQRSFHVTFLNVRANKIKEAREKIMEFQNQFSELFEETPGDAVYQLSIQLTPATEISKNPSQNL